MKLVLAIAVSLCLVASNQTKRFTLEQRVVLANQLGYNVSNVGGYNERISAKERILALDKKVKNLILGSSRVLKFKTKKKQGKKNLNLGVSSASMYDVMALYCIFDQYSTSTPKKIYFGIDPWMFVNQKADKRWRSSYKKYYDYFNQLLTKKETKITLPKENDTISVKTISELYSIEKCKLQSEKAFGNSFKYNQLVKDFGFETKTGLDRVAQINELITSISFTDKLLKDSTLVLNDVGENLKHEIQVYSYKSYKKLKYYQQYNMAKFNRLLLELSYGLSPSKIGDDFPTKQENALSLTRLKNGNIMYAEKQENREQKIVDKIVKKKMKHPYFLLPSFEMTSANTSLFELFVKYMEDKGSEVVLVMLPYHPTMYKSMAVETSKYHFPIELEDYLHKYAKESNISVVGSFNPTKCSLTKNDFFDEMHFKADAWLSILKAAE